MATDIHHGPSGLMVTRIAGPASEGADRRRWQFTTPLPGGFATLTLAEVADLIAALIMAEAAIAKKGSPQ